MTVTPPSDRTSQPSPWNLPNAITVVRIFFAPVFFVLLLLDGGQMGGMRVAAGLLFVIGMATDGIDGHIARSRNLVTDFGKIADPIADKSLVGAALIGLSILGDVAWWITILILVREVGLTVFRFAVINRMVIPASRAGKLKTVVQVVSIGSSMIPTWLWLGDWVKVANFWLLMLALALTLVSGVIYLVEFWLHNRAPRGGAPTGERA